MQEQKWVGDDVLTENVTDEQLRSALDDETNRAVTVHKPGSKFKANGIDYRVATDGRIESQKKAKRRAKNKAAKKARARNRK